MKRLSISIAAAIALVTSSTPSHAYTTGTFEWLNTMVPGFNARTQTSASSTCIWDSWGGAYNSCGSTVLVEMTPSITFPASGYTSSTYLAFYPVSTVSLSCEALYVVNPSGSNIGTGINYWTSGWTTSNRITVPALAIPAAAVFYCQVPSGQTLESVYITGTNTP